MPTLWAHDRYWTTGSTVVVQPSTTAGVGAYPSWQGTVILPSLFGGLQAWWERLADCWRLTRLTWRLTGERRALLQHTATALGHPVWPAAQFAVRKTATTLGFNRPEAWKPLYHELKRSAGDAENTFRHLNTCAILDTALLARGSTMTNPQRHFLAELAYQDFALRQR